MCVGAYIPIFSLNSKTISFSLTKTWSWGQSHRQELEGELGSPGLEEMRPSLVKNAQHFLTSIKE